MLHIFNILPVVCAQSAQISASFAETECVWVEVLDKPRIYCSTRSEGDVAAGREFGKVLAEEIEGCKMGLNAWFCEARVEYLANVCVDVNIGS